MMVLATFEWLQSSPNGGSPYWKTENKVIVGDTEVSIKSEIDKFLEEEYVWRKHISLKDVKRI
ncbi:MAG: hypothetical protein NC410_09160 [Oscillibacter sp.]|nr:hypothetical protein [Oscillibacter sp.]